MRGKFPGGSLTTSGLTAFFLRRIAPGSKAASGIAHYPEIGPQGRTEIASNLSTSTHYTAAPRFTVYIDVEELGVNGTFRRSALPAFFTCAPMLTLELGFYWKFGQSSEGERRLNYIC